jgi:hypothetical protein
LHDKDRAISKLLYPAFLALQTSDFFIVQLNLLGTSAVPDTIAEEIKF